MLDYLNENLNGPNLFGFCSNSHNFISRFYKLLWQIRFFKMKKISIENPSLDSYRGSICC